MLAGYAADAAATFGIDFVGLRGAVNGEDREIICGEMTGEMEDVVRAVEANRGPAFEIIDQDRLRGIGGLDGVIVSSGVVPSSHKGESAGRADLRGVGRSYSRGIEPRF